MNKKIKISLYRRDMIRKLLEPVRDNVFKNEKKELFEWALNLQAKLDGKKDCFSFSSEMFFQAIYYTFLYLPTDQRRIIYLSNNSIVTGKQIGRAHV